MKQIKENYKSNILIDNQEVYYCGNKINRELQSNLLNNSTDKYPEIDTENSSYELDQIEEQSIHYRIKTKHNFNISARPSKIIDKNELKFIPYKKPFGLDQFYIGLIYVVKVLNKNDPPDKFFLTLNTRVLDSSKDYKIHLIDEIKSKNDCVSIYSLSLNNKLQDLYTKEYDLFIITELEGRILTTLYQYIIHK